MDEVRKALEAGRDINATRFGVCALESAIQGGHKDLVVYLLEQKAELKQDDPRKTFFSAIHTAVCARDLDILKLLIDLKAEVNGRDASGLTPLMDAGRGNALKCCKYLVEVAHANPSLRCNRDRTALDWANRNGCRKVSRYLSRSAEEKKCACM